MAKLCQDKQPCVQYPVVSLDSNLNLGEDRIACRHGLVSEKNVCPLEIQTEYEKKQWKIFFNKLPSLQKKLTKSLFKWW